MAAWIRPHPSLWLVDEAAASPGPGRFLAEVGGRLLADGLPLAGGALTLAVPHPIITRRARQCRAENRAVIEAYPGRRIAAQVQAGALRRGTGETIRAALLSADLRDFTVLSEATEPRGAKEHAVAQIGGYLNHSGGSSSSRMSGRDGTSRPSAAAIAFKVRRNSAFQGSSATSVVLATTAGFVAIILSKMAC